MSPRSKKENEKIKAARKKSLRDAALEIFASHGYHNSTISVIAGKAGVSKGLVYNYYKSKEDLLKAIVTEMMDESMEYVQQIEDAQSIREKIHLLLTFSLEFVEANPKLMRLWLALTLQPDATKIMKEQSSEMTKKMIGYLIKLLKSAEVTNPEGETYILSATLDGLAVHYLYFKDDDDYPWTQIKESFIDNTFKHLNL